MGPKCSFVNGGNFRLSRSVQSSLCLFVSLTPTYACTHMHAHTLNHPLCSSESSENVRWERLPNFDKGCSIISLEAQIADACLHRKLLTGEVCSLPDWLTPGEDRSQALADSLRGTAVHFLCLRVRNDIVSNDHLIAYLLEDSVGQNPVKLSCQL